MSPGNVGSRDKWICTVTRLGIAITVNCYMTNAKLTKPNKCLNGTYLDDSIRECFKRRTFMLTCIYMEITVH